MIFNIRLTHPVHRRRGSTERCPATVELVDATSRRPRVPRGHVARGCCCPDTHLRLTRPTSHYIEMTVIVRLLGQQGFLFLARASAKICSWQLQGTLY